MQQPTEKTRAMRYLKQDLHVSQEIEHYSDSLKSINSCT